MPPKPFKPPRPSTSASSSANPSSKSSKSTGRPRKSSPPTSISKPKTKSKLDTGFQKASTNAGIRKKVNVKGKGKERRLSAREMGLPSLSPDSELESEGEEGEGEGDVDMDEEEAGDEGDPFSSQLVRKPSTSASKRRSHRAPTLSRSPSPSQQLQHENSNGVDDNEEARQESIPPNLLSHLLHSMFTQQGTRISKSANAAVGRYMETFVREGVARCVWARAEGAEGGGGGDGGFLEVEDLERLGPQLLLDF
ncbi:CENP-S associating centromere protein X-domain-containing protein [Tricladium varicosporioides]|nr:CENP-S associating centromere protein X-domain-containing protein [Hymenoscyphus varicosporioides]